MSLPTVMILRSGNRIVLDPTTPEIAALVEPELRYIEKKFFNGPELVQRRKCRLPPFEEIVWECFSEDYRGRLATSFGFVPRITRKLRSAGYTVVTRWGTETEAAQAQQRNETVYKPNWERIEALVKNGYEFRHRQREILELIATKPNGRISCPPGWG